MASVDQPRPRSARARRTAMVQHLILVLICAGSLFPFLTMALTAFKSPADVMASPPHIWPREWSLANFGDALRAFPVGRYLFNTLLLVGLNIVGVLISCPLVAYALAKIRFWGNKPLMVTVLVTMMLPPQVTMIPVYKMWDELGLIGTLWPLIIPHFLGFGFYIFLLRQFFMGVPDALLESARIDGASELQIYARIVLPLAKPALATVAIFQFVATWTDFLGPLLYLRDPSKYTLSIGLYSFFGEHGVEWGALMAACLIFTLPAIGLFAVAQKYFVEGISATGIK